MYLSLLLLNQAVVKNQEFRKKCFLNFIADIFCKKLAIGTEVNKLGICLSIFRLEAPHLEGTIFEKFRKERQMSK